MKEILPVALVTLLFLAGCKKDDPPAAVYPDYFNLEVGNYWKYRYYDQVNGVQTPTSEFDSIKVEADTAINGQRYFKVVSYFYPDPSPRVSFLRDSLHYVVNRLGIIQFSSENFTDTLHSGYLRNGSDTIAYFFSQMTDNDLVIDVPAGSFATKNFQTTQMLQGFFTPDDQRRYWHRRYAEDVGLVEEFLPYLSSEENGRVRRLVEYGQE